MDSKSKGKSWVGNIYQRFEAMCQEVDNIVGQEAVKFVEDHVQNVGESVKIFCSGVVQDILPPFMTIQIKEKPVDVETKESSAEICVDTSVQETVMEKQSPYEDFPELKNLPESFLLSGDQAQILRETSITDVERKSSQEEGTLHIGENVMEEKELSPLEGLSSLEHGNLVGASLYSEPIHGNDSNEFCSEAANATLVSRFGVSSSSKEETVGNRFLDEVESVSKTSSTLRSSESESLIACCENKIEQMSIVPSSSYSTAESYYLSDSSNENIPQEAESSCCNADSVGNISEFHGDLSTSQSFPALACDSKDDDVRLTSSSSIFSLESGDTNRTNEAVSVAGSSQSEHDQHCNCAQFEAFMPSSEIGPEDDSTIDVADTNMDTIDLSDNVKFEESCIIVEGKPFYAFSCRARKFRSYKKVIQDAFASRKRLTKEYEQLAVRYGDVDIGCSQHPKSSTLPSIGNNSLQLKKAPTQVLFDSEWELL